MRRVCAIILLVAMSAHAAPYGDVARANRTRFIARHRCAVVARLNAMHRRGPVEDSQDRFLIFRLRGEPQRYVQCMFEDRDTRMICEASSGAYGPTGSGQLRLSASARAALRALGYVQASTDQNFVRHIGLGDPPDLTIAADLMMATLHDGYGARPGSAIEVLAPSGDDPAAPCGMPVS